MKCPVDDETLVMADRNGVEIDYCPKCRGVWLDRGELDKIIERAAPEAAPTPPRGPGEDRYRGDDRYRHHGHRPYRKKKSLLGEIFDF